MGTADLTEEAWELIRKAPHVINRLAEKINESIDEIANGKDKDDNVEIIHVGYDDDQLGREK